MNRSVSEITEEALQLPESEQFKLARTLLENAQVENITRIDQTWNEEIERRIAAIDSGLAKGRPFTDVLRDLDQHLRQEWGGDSSPNFCFGIRKRLEFK